MTLLFTIKCSTPTYLVRSILGNIFRYLHISVKLRGKSPTFWICFFRFSVGFKKTMAFQPRVIKQNRGSSGEGIWIIKLKEGRGQKPVKISSDFLSGFWEPSLKWTVCLGKQARPQKETIVFQASIFRCELLVSGRVDLGMFMQCKFKKLRKYTFFFFLFAPEGVLKGCHDDAYLFISFCHQDDFLSGRKTVDPFVGEKLK